MEIRRIYLLYLYSVMIILIFPKPVKILTDQIDENAFSSIKYELKHNNLFKSETT